MNRFKTKITALGSPAIGFVGAQARLARRYISTVINNGRRLACFLTSLRRPYKIGLSILAGVLVIVAFSIFSSKPASAAWFNDSWLYRKQVAVANASGGTLTDFQVSISLDTATLITAGKMQSNCADVRVTDQNGQLIPYWPEETGNFACNDTDTKIWTKVPSIPTSGSSVYVYYGNSSASVASSGVDTFQFFDDFSGTSVDTSKWNQAASPTQSSGVASLTNGATLVSQTTATTSTTGVMGMRAKVNATANETARLGFSNSAAASTSYADDAMAVVMGDEQVYLANKGGANLVSHYKLEETTATDANQFKASGYLDTGKLNQAVSMYGNAAGTDGSTLTFNRGAQISGNNYENINTNQGTISFWVKPNWSNTAESGAHTSSDPRYKYFAEIPAGVHTLSLVYDDYWNQVRAQTGSGDGAYADAKAVTITAGNWYHIVMEWDLDNVLIGSKEVRLFVNNSEGTNSTINAVLDAPSGVGHVGTTTSNALIDDFAIYDRVLTTTEIASLYNSGTGREAGYVADSSLKFYAKLDGTGTLQPVTYNAGASASKMQAAKDSGLTGVTNLVNDAQMEKVGLTDWSFNSNGGTGGGIAKIAAATSGGGFDTQVLEVTGSTQVSSWANQSITVTGNTTYTFSGWAKQEGGSDGYMNVYDNINLVFLNVCEYVTGSNGAWARTDCSFKTAANTTQVTIYLYSLWTPGAKSYWDNISLTPNSVNNGGMEGTYASGVAPGWTCDTGGGATCTEEGSTVHSGSKSQKVSSSAAGIYTSGISTTIGNWYLVDGWLNVSSGFVSFNVGTGSDSGYASRLTNLESTGGWQHYSIIFQSTAATMYVSTHRFSGLPAVWYVDDVSITPLSNVATSFKAWTPVTDTGSNAELVPTGHFDSNITGWSTLATTGYSYETFEWSNGKLHAVNDLVTNTPYFGYANSPVFSVTAGKQYLVEFDLVNNAGTLPQFTIASSDQGGGITSEGYVPSTVGHNRKVFNVITSSGSGRFFFNNYNNVADYTLDNVTVKEIANPLSIHGDSDGVISTSSGVRGNAYTFDGSTGYLRQKTYDVNVGTLSYSTNDIVDSGQTFEDWDNDNGGAAEYMAVVTNSDNTTSWGYLCANITTPLTQSTVYTKKDCSTGANGFNGTSPSGKTPVGYEVRKTDYQITGSMTVGAWVKNPSYSIISKVEDSNSATNYAYNVFVGGQVYTPACFATGANGALICGTTNLRDSNWHFVVAVLDLTGSAKNLYVDGILDSTGGYGTPDDAPQPLQIGSYNKSGVDRYNGGSIDSPFVLDTALTADQIKDIYNSSSEKYTLVSNNESVNGIKESTVSIDANYHNFEISQNGTAASLSVDGATPVTTATNLANEDSYVRLQNSDSTNTASVDWVYVRKYAATSPVATPATEEVGPGPVGYWKFDDPTSTPSGGTSGQAAMDSSGQGNNGVLGSTINADSADPTWRDESMCVSGKCLQFDGTDNYVDVGAGPGVVNTVSFWSRAITTSEHYIDLNGSAYISTAGGTVSATGFTSPTIYVDGVASTTVTANAWHHISVTTVASLNANDLDIGRLEGTDYFNGFIDEVKIYPYVRTAEEVKQDYITGAASAGSNAVLGGNNNLGGNNQELSEGLVGYWKMDESSAGSAQVDRVDSSGNSNTLTDTNTVASGAGKFGNGSDFEYSNSEYVTIADGSQSGLDVGSQLTISTWIKPESFVSTNIILAKYNTTGNQRGYRINTLPSGAIQFLLSTDGSTYSIAATGAASVTLNNWYHVVATYDGTQAKIYINNTFTEVASTNPLALTGDINDNTASFMIGKQDSLLGYTFDGVIDEVRVYNRALSQEEIGRLYNFAPGPVAHYTFDEGEGQSANDISGNDNTGTLGSSTGVDASDPAWTQGKYGKALSFDGTDDYVDAGNKEVFKPNLGSYTVEAWARSSQNINERIVSVRDDSTSPIRTGFELYADSGKYRFDLTDGTGGYQTVSTSSSYDNLWHHVVGVIDRGNNLNKLYVDGVLENTYTISTLGTINPNAGLIIGKYSTARWNGLIDDVRIYNYARTQAQIIEDMNAGHPAVGTPVGSSVLHLSFDEGYGDTAYDKSPQGNNGDLGGSGQTCPASGTVPCPAWNNDGKLGKALNFDGSNDYVSIPWTTDLPEASLSMWMKSDSSFAGTSIFFEGDGTAVASSPSFEGSSTALRFYVANGCLLSTSYTQGEWTHFVGAWNGSNSYLYKNGKQVATGICTATESGFSKFVLGSRSGGNPSDVTMDEVKIYPFALTAGQVITDYNQGKAIVFGSTGTESDGVTASNSASRAYCVPGDTATCNPPVAEWKFEEGTGTTADDTSGNGNTGTLTGGPSWTQGRVGKALSFDGVNDWITYPAGVATGGNEITVSGWLKVDGDGTNWARIILGGQVNSTYTLTKVTGADDRILWRPVGNSDNFYSTTTLSRGDWHHFAGTYDSAGGADNVKIYIDGKLDAMFTDTGVIPTNVSSGVIGGESGAHEGGGQTSSFDGQIDQVRIYNYARTPAQIAWEYNKGAPVAWYKFDECSGTTINDWAPGADTNSFAGNTGTLNIGATGTQTSAGTCESGTGTEAWNNGTTGHENASMSFDGTDDWVETGSVDFLGNGNDVTVAIWVKPGSSQKTYANIIDHDHSTGGAGNYGNWVIQQDNTTTNSYYFAFTYDGTNFDGTSKTTQLTSSTWQHLVMVKSGTSLDHYLNGVKQGSTSTVQNNITTESSPLRIGDNVNPVNNRDFNGQIDDVRIYNYALTEEQIKQVYNGGAVNFK